MAQDFTLETLTGIMRTAAGVSEDVDLAGDIADVSFEDLGYDSLAVLEIQAHIAKVTGVVVPEDALDQTDTPRRALDFVNDQLVKVA
ncbi:acyl carrier protein [Amycolatopsis sp. NPDC059657]|uniref:acyl carrier protein n=1 Tax=Amycolatopsis sp. NPDC059657 TaxID=3346899 RepID=UPI00366A6805